MQPHLYKQYCEGLMNQNALTGEKHAEESEITVHELKRRLDIGSPIHLLDVREPHEYKICNLGGQLIPLRQLGERKVELDADKETVVYCHHGVRSQAAVTFLQRAGFRNVKNLVGGIDAWARNVDTKMPRY
jgi:rhodanese-related sulfurtransferase